MLWLASRSLQSSLVVAATGRTATFGAVPYNNKGIQKLTAQECVDLVSDSNVTCREYL